MDFLFSEKLIRKRIIEVADQISSDYEDREVLIIGVLNGSFIFCADMVRNLINVKFKMDFISLSLYSGTHSTEKMKIVSKFKENVTGKNVLILDDVIETGMTLNFIIKEVISKNPKSVKTCVLLDKRCMREKNVFVEYICLEMAANMGNDFVVGYGLDYNGFFRGLPYICKLKELVR
ncbi:MAG: hypoxanthine phosphoribosyltransferase [Endomicrobium sp.]|jgi:hypoxanthine phosphoribosyltransferase|nr:hypoxanthine phosphoribosyltransferase [Endomicrobium sp.]